MTLARGGKKNENRDGMQRYNGACVFLIEEEPHHHVHRFANASATSVHTLPFAIPINAHKTNSVPFNTIPVDMRTIGCPSWGMNLNLQSHH